MADLEVMFESSMGVGGFGLVVLGDWGWVNVELVVDGDEEGEGLGKACKKAKSALTFLIVVFKE